MHREPTADSWRLHKLASRWATAALWVLACECPDSRSGAGQPGAPDPAESSAEAGWETGLTPGPAGSQGTADLEPVQYPLNDSHPQRWGGSEHELYFIGRHGEGANDFSTPAFAEYLKGSDLGVSVKLGDTAFFYMGDSSWMGGQGSRMACDLNPVSGDDDPCNDAIVVSSDGEPQDGIDTQLVTEWDTTGDTDELRFKPISIPGVHADFPGDPPSFGPFSVPTGGTLIHKAWADNDAELPTIVLWYATHTNPPLDQLGEQASWSGCSLDGTDFFNCYQFDPNWGAPFSRAKFVQVSPVFVEKDALDRACDTSPASVLCQLNSPSSNGGILLFGAGPLYRCSSLHLAYVSVERFGELETTWPHPPAGVAYFDGEGWSADETDAAPIIAIDPTKCLDSSSDPQSPTWCLDEDQNHVCDSTEAGKNSFGEFSVRLVSVGLPTSEAPYLIMLSNHVGHPVQYRTARLGDPQLWSDPQSTASEDYGPYLIDGTAEHAGMSGELVIYHVISTWNGMYENQADSSGHNPYGVYTTPLLVDWGLTYNHPEWPPQQ